jgi:hypothetical protein
MGGEGERKVKGRRNGRGKGKGTRMREREKERGREGDVDGMRTRTRTGTGWVWGKGLGMRLGAGTSFLPSFCTIFSHVVFHILYVPCKRRGDVCYTKKVPSRSIMKNRINTKILGDYKSYISDFSRKKIRK